MFEKMFKLKENNTTVKTEVVAGLTTFMTMAYILALNPAILSVSGMDPQAVLMATALAAFIGTIAMALLANYPFALAPGLGLNAYFAYTVCGTMGYSWQVALFAVFIEGLIFILLSLTNVREAIFNAIPTQLKKGVSVGIGLFVAFIGLQDAGIIVDGSTLVTVVKFTENFRTPVSVRFSHLSVCCSSLFSMLRELRARFLSALLSHGCLELSASSPVFIRVQACFRSGQISTSLQLARHSDSALTSADRTSMFLILL